MCTGMTAFGIKSASPPLIRWSNVKHFKLRKKSPFLFLHSTSLLPSPHSLKESRRDRHDRLVLVNAADKNEDYDIMVPEEYIEAEIDSVTERDRCGVLSLRLKDERQTILVMYIGDFESSQMLQTIQRKETARPMPYDFMRNSLKVLGYHVNQIRVTSLVGHTYHARVYYKSRTTGDVFSVDARPSDAVNIALRFDAPLYIHREVAHRMGTAPGYTSRRRPEVDIAKLCREEINRHHDPTVMLKLQMQMAIAQEKYTAAAKLRDEIDKMLASDRVMSLVVAMESALSGGRLEEAMEIRDELRQYRRTIGGSEKHKSH